MSDIVDKGIVPGDQRAILVHRRPDAAVSIVASVCAIVGSFYSAKVATGFGRSLRGAIFGARHNLSIHQFARFWLASLVTRTTNDTTQVQQM
jgi:ATP-binding cassette subfamily B protein